MARRSSLVCFFISPCFSISPLNPCTYLRDVVAFACNSAFFLSLAAIISSCIIDQSSKTSNGECFKSLGNKEQSQSISKNFPSDGIEVTFTYRKASAITGRASRPRPFGPHYIPLYCSLSSQSNCFYETPAKSRVRGFFVQLRVIHQQLNHTFKRNEKKTTRSTYLI
jgi:hypothetical protein